MADVSLRAAATTSSPLNSSAAEADESLSVTKSDAHQEPAGEPSPLYQEVEVPCHSTRSAPSSDTAASTQDQPLDSALSPHAAPRSGGGGSGGGGDHSEATLCSCEAKPERPAAQQQPVKRKRLSSHNESDTEENTNEEEEEDDKEVQRVSSWRAPASTQAGVHSSKAAANTDVAGALAAFSSNIHGVIAPQVSRGVKSSLSPHHSHVPWHLSESEGNGRDDDDGSQVLLSSFDADGASGSIEEQTWSPPPPKLRTRIAPPTTHVVSNPIGSAARIGGGGIVNTGVLLTSPPGELLEGASIGSDPAAVDSGSYGWSGCLDSDTATAAAAVNAPAARFGGGGVLRHNPANLTFSGSGSGSQGGDAAIDRSMSSHFSVPSRGAASLSPPFLAVDDESGELVVAFRRDGLGKEPRHHGGSPTSSFTESSFAAAAASSHGGARGGVQTSPTHLDPNNTLDETFGTMLSTMSTTFSTTTNSVGDVESGSPGDTYRLQVAAQMRQALLQTLGLSASSSTSSVALGAQGGRQRSEKATSVASMAASSGEATTSPMRDSGQASTYSYFPRLPHLGQTGGGGGGAHAIATPPPTSSSNPSSAAANLASSASLCTNSTTSPTSGAQSRTVASMFAALTTPSPRLRNAHRQQQQQRLHGAVDANPAFSDIDSDAEEEEGEGRSDGQADPQQPLKNEEGPRVLSLSVSSPLVYEDLPSSEISSSQQFSAAVQPPPNLQLAHPSHHRSLTEDFSEFVDSRRSTFSGTPTSSATKLYNTGDDIFSNSTSSLLPPVLKSTARGGGEQAAALEAAAAEAVREVSDGQYSVGEEKKEEKPMLLKSQTVEVVGVEGVTSEESGSNLRSASNSGISPLNIEEAPSESNDEYHSSSAAAHPLGWLFAVSKAPVVKKGAGEEHKEEAGEAKVVHAPRAAPAKKADVSSAESASPTTAAALASPDSGSHAEVNDAIPVAALECSSHSLSISARTHHYRGEDGVNSDDDDVSGTATTQAPNSTPSSQFQIQPVSSTNFGEAPELLLDAAPITTHFRRDAVSSPTTLSSTSTRLLSDGIVTAAAVFRRYNGDAAQDRAESPVVPQRYSPFLPTPTPHVHNPNLGAGASVSGKNVKEPKTGASQVIQDNSSNDDDDIWEKPMNSAQLPPLLSRGQEKQDQRTAVEEEEDEKDAFAEPAVAPVAASAEKHVQFADPSATQFTDPPSSPWADNDFFYDPDYTYMEFKSVSDRGDSDNHNGGDDDGVADEEEAEILRRVPHFRFKHRCANVHGSPSSLTAPSWAAAWSHDANPGRSTTQAGEAHEDATSHNDDDDDDSGEGEHAPRVFFTKERLASRAALMEARRAALQRNARASITHGNAGARVAAKTDDAAASAGAAVTGEPAFANSDTGLRIHLAPPPPVTPTAASISVSLPDFAAPVTTASPVSAANNAGDDDGFGGWVVQQSPAPQPAAMADPTSFTLTRKWCTQVAAELKKRGEALSWDASAIAPVNSARVVEVLRTVFGKSSLSSPHSKSADTSASVNLGSHDADEASEALNATTSTAVSGEIRGVDGVLEALSFTSLTHRNGAASVTGWPTATLVPASASALNTTRNMSMYASAPAVMEDGGYVVPWRTRTSATNTVPTSITSLHPQAETSMNGAAAAATTAASETEAEATDQDADHCRSALAAEVNEENASLRLTRHLLFPGEHEQADGNSNDAPRVPAAACSVSAFMGTRRLPDAPNAAQWTERDVLLAVQQEQQRMAQEDEGAVETERLEDVLRLSS